MTLRAGGRGYNYKEAHGISTAQMMERNKTPTEWKCKRCGLLRSNKQTHKHGKKMTK